MKCANCGNELPEGALFCSQCGTKVTAEAQALAPVYQTEVKSMLKTGKLTVYRDRTEFSTSSVQKTVFNYSAMVSIKKRLVPTPAILFVTEDGHIEACPATMKNVHEAFMYIEKAAAPYLEERLSRLREAGVRYSFISSSGLTGGILNVSDDHVEFKGKSGQSEIISYTDVRSAGISRGISSDSLEFRFYDGRSKTFTLDKQTRDEVVSYVLQSIQPFVEQHKADLLAQGIYFSFLTTNNARMDIYQDMAKLTVPTGQSDVYNFKRLREVKALADTVEFFMVDGTSRSFPTGDEDARAVTDFIAEAIRPYVEQRTVGFDKAFGADDIIEFNEERGVFHILRRNKTVIGDELATSSIVKCRPDEAHLNRMINGIISGGKAVLGADSASDDVKVTSVGVILTVSGETERDIPVRFSSFPLGISRYSDKYAEQIALTTAFMEYLSSVIPFSEITLPEPPPEPQPIVELEDTAELTAPDSAPQTSAEAEDIDPLGIGKYIERAALYIDRCPTPMTIAIQGGRVSGGRSVMDMLADRLQKDGRDGILRFRTQHYAYSDLGDKLPTVIGAELINLLGGTGDGSGVKVAKGLINVLSNAVTKGATDGQFLIDAFFKDNVTNADDIIGSFHELTAKKAGGEKGKVIIFIDGLDSFAPVKAIELLEAMGDFFSSRSCVFVAAADHDAIVRGYTEKYGASAEKGDAFFNKIFRISFRLPSSGFNISAYVDGKLDAMGMKPESERESSLYAALTETSVGREPESMDRLFDSFLLLKTLADEEAFEDRVKRLTLFALLCMQTRFRPAYNYLMAAKDVITPDFLSRLCAGELDAGIADGERESFASFAAVLGEIINTDGETGVSEAECAAFGDILDFTAITLR